MPEYRNSLELYKGPDSHYQCPQCGQKEFTRYIDNETKQHIDSSVGMCNRKNKCGYHCPPHEFFNSGAAQRPTSKKPFNFTPKEPKKTSYMDIDICKNTFRNYEQNNFVQYLISTFGNDIAARLIEKYNIGTSAHQFRNKDYPDYKSEKGASVFWYVDINSRVRGGKIMLYKPDTGKRIKEPFNHITWLHSVLKLPDFSLNQCLFGEHLLRDNTKPVGIVESEKTAIVASANLPDITWLATGGMVNMNEEKFKVLQNRKVTLFPDINGFEKWTEKAEELSHITNFQVSDLLEINASPEARAKGLDIADYLIEDTRRNSLNKTMELLIENYSKFCDEFAAGKKTIEENKIYSRQLELQLIKNQIPFEDFVIATSSR